MVAMATWAAVAQTVGREVKASREAPIAKANDSIP
jgi:hypothetical protein